MYDIGLLLGLMCLVVINGQVSQSAQFAPFNADYQANYAGMTIYNDTITQRKSYNGSAVQQAITCLTQLPETVFKRGGVFATFGFEYFASDLNLIFPTRQSALRTLVRYPPT